MEAAVKCAVCSGFCPDHEPGFLGWGKIPTYLPEKTTFVSDIRFSPSHLLLAGKVSTGVLAQVSPRILVLPGFSAPPQTGSSPHLKSLPAFFQSSSSISLWSLDSSPLPKTQTSVPLRIPQKVIRREVFGVKCFGVKEQAFCTKLVWCIWRDWGGTKSSLFKYRWIKYVACFHLFLGKHVLW